MWRRDGVCVCTRSLQQQRGMLRAVTESTGLRSCNGGGTAPACACLPLGKPWICITFYTGTPDLHANRTLIKAQSHAYPICPVQQKVTPPTRHPRRTLSPCTHACLKLLDADTSCPLSVLRHPPHAGISSVTFGPDGSRRGQNLAEPTKDPFRTNVHATNRRFLGSSASHAGLSSCHAAQHTHDHTPKRCRLHARVTAYHPHAAHAKFPAHPRAAMPRSHGSMHLPASAVPSYSSTAFTHPQTRVALLHKHRGTARRHRQPSTPSLSTAFTYGAIAWRSAQCNRAP